MLPRGAEQRNGGAAPHFSMTSSARPPKRLLRLFNPSDCRGAVAHNKDNRVLVLGAIPVHLLAEMGDEGSRRHGYGIGRIELIAGSDPPCALEHRNESVV